MKRIVALLFINSLLSIDLFAKKMFPVLASSKNIQQKSFLRNGFFEYSNCKPHFFFFCKYSVPNSYQTQCLVPFITNKFFFFFLNRSNWSVKFLIVNEQYIYIYMSSPNPKVEHDNRCVSLNGSQFFRT